MSSVAPLTGLQAHHQLVTHLGPMVAELFLPEPRRTVDVRTVASTPLWRALDLCEIKTARRTDPAVTDTDVDRATAALTQAVIAEATEGWQRCLVNGEIPETELRKMMLGAFKWLVYAPEPVVLPAGNDLELIVDTVAPQMAAQQFLHEALALCRFVESKQMGRWQTYIRVLVDSIVQADRTGKMLRCFTGLIDGPAVRGKITFKLKHTEFTVGSEFSATRSVTKVPYLALVNVSVDAREFLHPEDWLRVGLAHAGYAARVRAANSPVRFAPPITALDVKTATQWVAHSGLTPRGMHAAAAVCRTGDMSVPEKLRIAHRASVTLIPGAQRAVPEGIVPDTIGMDAVRANVVANVLKRHGQDKVHAIRTVVEAEAVRRWRDAAGSIDEKNYRQLADEYHQLLAEFLDVALADAEISAMLCQPWQLVERYS
ncbi:hypothetical protein [Corynebacterium ulceribovis]|uniref:hypothetical protein n=1 Tax=Corynebacterium ulceribovis TaxID=487732 RepID=UPI0012E9B3D2|nr:hypothetical protein [Corynebacterium ulceribovis]